MEKVANICDVGYIGIRHTLSLLAPLLQSPRRNPHATFVTLFINAVQEIVKIGHEKEETPNIDFFTNYLPFPQMSFLFTKSADSWMNDAEMLRIWDARAN